MTLAPSARRLVIATAASCLLLSPAAADVFLLKDGKKIEGEYVDKGAAYEVKTKYGSLTIEKSEVLRVVKSADAMAQEAEASRKKAQAALQEALAIEVPENRLEKLSLALDQFEKAAVVYRDAREIFTGEAYARLDQALTAVIQETRACRDHLEATRNPKPASQKASGAASATPDRSEDASAKAGAPAKDGAAAAAPSEAPTLASPTAPPAVPPGPDKDRKEPVQAAAFDAPAAPKVKTVGGCLEDLKSGDSKTRREALKGLSEAPRAPDIAQALGENLVRERERDLLFITAALLTQYDPETAFKAARRAGEMGETDQRRAAIAVVKKVGGDGAVKWLIETFLIRRQPDHFLEVASALKKNSKTSVPELVATLGRTKDAAVMEDIIKILGVIGDPRGAAVLVKLLASPEHSRNSLVALQKIGKSAVPELIRGLGGPSSKLCGFLLREITRQGWTSSNGAEWSKWWSENEALVRLEDVRDAERDAKRDWAVGWDDFRGYDKQTLADADAAPSSVPSNAVKGAFRGGGFKIGGRR